MAGSFQSNTCHIIPLNPLTLAVSIRRSSKQAANLFAPPGFCDDNIFQIQALPFPGGITDIIQSKADDLLCLPSGPGARATRAHHTGLAPKPLSIK